MKKAFSLIELLISLIIISLIAAAFTPMVTTKLKYQNTTIAFNSPTLLCAKYDAQARCLMCTNKGCSLCSTQFDVPEGKYVYPLEGCDYKNCPTECKTCTMEGCLTCKGGYGYNSAQKTCSLCQMGWYSAGGTSVCNKCSGNFISSTNGALSCSECRISEHKYANAANTACLNKTCNAKEYINNITCIACPEGTYQEAINHQKPACENCPSGYYCTGGSKYPCMENCISCSNASSCNTCADGFRFNNGKCERACPNNSFMIGNLCVQKYNAGDLGGLSIPSGIALSSVTSANSGVGKHYDMICWRGRTSNGCDSKAGDYSGCNRTVCTWTAANKICTAHGWRLPSIAELRTFFSYRELQMCDRASSSSTYCAIKSGCERSQDGNCIASDVWSSERPNNYSTIFLNQGSLQQHESYSSNAYSVRCVKNL